MDSTILSVLVIVVAVGVVIFLVRNDNKKNAARKAAQELARAEAEAARVKAEADKRAELVAKWGEETTERILHKKIGTGDPLELVLEMFGTPDGTDHKVLKTKVKQTLKYFPRGRGHDLRISLEGPDQENLTVVGWDVKEGGDVTARLA